MATVLRSSEINFTSFDLQIEQISLSVEESSISTQGLQSMGPVLPSLYREFSQKNEIAKKMVRKATKEERKVYQNAKRGAKKRRISFHLTDAEFDILVTRANGRCEDTSIKFNPSKVPDKRYREDWMSIDRIDSSGPYSLKNCRLVTAAVNFSKGDQSFEVHHMRQLLYIARMGGSIDDKFLISRKGSDPEKWEY